MKFKLFAVFILTFLFSCQDDEFRENDLQKEPGEVVLNEDAYLKGCIRIRLKTSAEPNIQLSSVDGKAQTGIGRLDEIAAEKLARLTGGRDSLQTLYRPNCEEGSFAERLHRNLERDILFGATQSGPHKDDISFLVNGREAKVYGSQGQQRTTALAARLAEIGLSVPQVTALFLRLRELGVDVDPTTFTVEQAVPQLRALLEGRAHA